MTKPPESIHSVRPIHAFDARDGPASLSLYDAQSKEDALKACCKASWLKVTITFDPSIAPKETHYLSRMGFEWAKNDCDHRFKQLWESIEPTEANLEKLLSLPWAADKSHFQEQLDKWRAKAPGTFSMWKHTRTGGLRLVCLDQTPTMIESGNTPCPSWVLWLRGEPHSGGFLWDRDHRVQFDYLPEGGNEGISTGPIAPTIGEVSELGLWAGNPNAPSWHYTLMS